MTTATRITAAQYYELTVEGDCKQLVDGQIPALGTGRPTFDVALELRPGETLESPILPGFELSLEVLFRR